jgi:hypothetical protein
MSILKANFDIANNSSSVSSINVEYVIHNTEHAELFRLCIIEAIDKYNKKIEKGKNKK